MRKKKVQKFIKTYKKEKSILKQTFRICKGTSEWGEVGRLAGSVKVCKNEVNARIIQLIDLRDIYTKKELKAGEFPLDS